MATVKKKNTKKIVIAVIAVLLVVAIVVGSIFAKQAKNVETVSLSTISTNTIVQSVSSTGEVTSGLKKDYSAGTIATVKEVFVKVGDTVSKGDKLATFDTTSLDTQVHSLSTSYRDAVNSYNTAVQEQIEAKAQLEATNKAIAATEKEIAALPASPASQNTQNALSSSQYAEGTTGGLSNPLAGGSTFEDLEAQIGDLIQSIKDLQESISGINDRIDDLTAQLEQIAQKVNELDPNSVKRASLEIKLAGLNAEKEIYSVLASGTNVEIQKQVMNTSKTALDTLSAAQQSLKAGWVADFNGVVTSCNINAGGQTTALESGITVENMDTRVVTISLGEYDIHKVKVGMKATVKTAYGTYEGTVATIAPTATGASSSSMLDSVGSMAGISGLSSLTSSGAGVKVTVLVENPDEFIIIGFDADVEIETGVADQVPCVPIESIVLEKEGTYVYLYNEEEQTVTKTKITTGATSDTAYEITSGLSVGQKIVSTPKTDYKDETFKVKVAENGNPLSILK